MPNEDYNQRNNSPGVIAVRLTMIVGIVYVIFGLLGLINYFYQKSINFFQIFFYVSIGIGMFEKHAWSRILCIFTSGITILLGFYLFTSGGEVLWNGIPVISARLYAIVIVVVHSLLLYVVLRKDVKNIFSSKEN